MTILSAPIYYGHLTQQQQGTNCFYQSNMYFITLIRMMLLWLVLIARCSGSDVIPLDRAELSSTYNSTYIAAAAGAIDGNLTTRSVTTAEDPAWLRVYFKSSSTVGRVVVEQGFSYSTSCGWTTLFTVSVYDGGAETVCGTYTGKSELVQVLYAATLTLLL